VYIVPLSIDAASLDGAGVTVDVCDVVVLVVVLDGVDETVVADVAGEV